MMLDEAKHIAVTLDEEQELLSPQQAADRLGVSRQHVVRLIGYGDLEAQQLPGSTHWKIPLSSVLAFEVEAERHRKITDDWSRELDALGAPAE
jgi:excisionase family DNA binding protein